MRRAGQPATYDFREASIDNRRYIALPSTRSVRNVRAGRHLRDAHIGPDTEMATIPIDRTLPISIFNLKRVRTGGARRGVHTTCLEFTPKSIGPGRSSIGPGANGSGSHDRAGPGRRWRGGSQGASMTLLQTHRRVYAGEKAGEHGGRRSTATSDRDCC